MKKRSCVFSKEWITATAVLLVITVFLAGCGKRNRELAPISGKVTYQGKPLTFGGVVFQPESGQPAVGTIQQDGTFTLKTRGEGDGAVVGKNRVCVNCFEVQAPSARPHFDGDITMGKSLIPKRYLSCETSGIQIDVRLDNNDPVVLNLTD